jgi:hypothetical protein
MLEFCPHCGQLGGLVQQAARFVCTECGREAGVIETAERRVVHQADELIRKGSAAHCPVCRQLVEMRGMALARHYAPKSRKVCPGSARPSAAAEGGPVGPPGKDLSAYMTREAIQLVSCRRGAPPWVEQLTLTYLDKSDRVRIQIDALRDILGTDFRLGDYPSSLGRPQFAVWANAAKCVVGKKHEHGGCQPMSDAELHQVVADLHHHQGLFFI